MAGDLTPEAVATERRFGALVTVHEPPGPVVPIAMTLAGLAFYGTMVVMIARTSEVSAIVHWWAAFVGAGILVGVTVEEVSRGRRRNRPHLYEFTHGLVRAHRGTITAYAWDDLEYVERATYHHGAQGTGSWSYATVLRLRDGTGEVDILAPLDGVAGRIADAALIRARDSLLHGTPVHFGAITAGPGGLTIGDEFLPWRDLDRVDVGRRFVEIRRAGHRRPWRSLPIGDVPDSRALASLIHENTSARDGCRSRRDPAGPRSRRRCTA
ncbi:DUF6585 family protein [Catenuloplanes atrovinosus]|uniref:Uncharacterized protein n=1 Tax=Catenuloplanes atrovinosus TaxID=137266 RepID=A0AAE4CCA6_9ACTN|nr:DUF6585 family protein [Catenuloplanes atrovinosus]MDR7276345.1 hypothetical protein [Catenuloplanes atrovinosus]